MVHFEDSGYFSLFFRELSRHYVFVYSVSRLSKREEIFKKCYVTVRDEGNKNGKGSLNALSEISQKM